MDKRKIKHSNERKENIKNGLKNSTLFQQHILNRKENLHILCKYICEKCSEEFISKKLRKDRKKHCLKCKKNVVHNKDLSQINSIFDISKRTAIKILKRMNLMKCSICNWDEATCDIHHIYGRKIENANDHKYLILLCPNCHRKAHNNKININLLVENSLDKFLINWKNYYLK